MENGKEQNTEDVKDGDGDDDDEEEEHSEG